MFGTNKKLKVYLSGAMEYSPDGGISWRQAAQKFLLDNGFEVFNPCESSEVILHNNGCESVEEYNVLKTEIDEVAWKRKKYLKITRKFVHLDLLELRTSDIVLVQISDKASGGTAGELTVAYMLDIPVIGFTEGNLSDTSGWVLACVDNCEEKCSLDRALRTVISMRDSLSVAGDHYDV